MYLFINAFVTATVGVAGQNNGAKQIETSQMFEPYSGFYGIPACCVGESAAGWFSGFSNCIMKSGIRLDATFYHSFSKGIVGSSNFSRAELMPFPRMDIVCL